LMPYVALLEWNRNVFTPVTLAVQFTESNMDINPSIRIKLLYQLSAILT
jgi:hypothetical protein